MPRPPKIFVEGEQPSHTMITLPLWMKNQAKAKGINISEVARDGLSNRLTKDPMIKVNELEKELEKTLTHESVLRESILALRRELEEQAQLLAERNIESLIGPYFLWEMIRKKSIRNIKGIVVWQGLSADGIKFDPPENRTAFEYAYMSGKFNNGITPFDLQSYNATITSVAIRSRLRKDLLYQLRNHTGIFSEAKK